MIIEENYTAGCDTESEGMSLQPTPLSYNGDILFPPTPTTDDPLAIEILGFQKTAATTSTSIATKRLRTIIDEKITKLTKYIHA